MRPHRRRAAAGRVCAACRATRGRRCGPCHDRSEILGAMKILVLAALRFYKSAVSPMLPAACRYTPTCSEYAMEAVERYRVTRGGLLAVKRLASFHSWHHGGYDPVPDPTARLRRPSST